MLLQFFENLVFYNTFSNQDTSSVIGTHMINLFFPIGIFGDRPNRAPSHDAQLTEVHELAFNDYLSSSLSIFDCFEYVQLICEWLKP